MRRRVCVAAAVIAVGLGLTGCTGTPSTNHSSAGPLPAGPAADATVAATKLKHVVVIMQENRSFDSYFGTYPGADGLPANVCVPDPAGGCQRPFHDTADVNGGGPHGQTNAAADIDGGKMDGFIGQAHKGKKGCVDVNNPACTNGTRTDVMGYHDGGDIPNYWAYAQHFVLQDHMFEPNASWSLPEHLFQVSEWSAHCTTHDQPASCTNALQNPGNPPGGKKNSDGTAPIYAWTDLTYLLHRAGVSWGYYVVAGTEPDCANDEAVDCAPVKQNAKTPGIWNPLPYFDTVRADGQLGNIQSVQNFYTAAATGNLPAVSWIAPSGDVSEHPPAKVTAGQAYVTSLINAVMKGPDTDLRNDDVPLHALADRDLWTHTQRRWDEQQPGQWQAFVWRVAIPLSRRLDFVPAWR
jgi:phospholipase C